MKKVANTKTCAKKVAKRTANSKKAKKIDKAKLGWTLLLIAVLVIIGVILLALNLTCDENVTHIRMSDEAALVAQKLQTDPEAAGKLSLEEGYFDEILKQLYQRGDQDFPAGVGTINEINASYSLDALDLILDADSLEEIDTENLLKTASRVNNSIYTLGQDESENIVLYLHGGAYAFGITKAHVTFADKLASALNAKVYLPIYALAPQATYADIYARLTGLYEYLLAQNKKIFIMGDSAGGGLAMAFTEYLKTEGLRMPDKAVLLSPWLDVSCSNPEIADYESKDLTLATYGPKILGKLWAGDLDVKDPLVSPMYGDIKDLPGVMIFVGTNEIMYPDDTKFYGMLRDAGNDARLVIGDGFWHVFPIYNIPERATSIRMISEFCL